MNWDALGAIAELIGALAVIATLFYLASQIRQSNLLARRAESNAAMEQISLLRVALAQDENLAALFLKGAASFQQLSELERVQFENLMGQRFWNYAQIWNRVQSQTAKEENWMKASMTVSRMMAYPGIEEWWQEYKYQFPTGFISDVEGL